MKWDNGKLESGAAMNDGKAGSARTKGDERGWKRGECGFARSKGDEAFFAKSNPASAYSWSPGGKGKVGDFSGGKLKDTFKGYDGVDGDGGTQ